jgi:glutamate synthase (ferredoxin)
VRNSGALAVIEGAGDHLCEYMTGGVVVSLGPVGKNVGAGMTGGLAYVFEDPAEVGKQGVLPLELLVNPEIVKLQRVGSKAGEQQLKEAIQGHYDATGSAKAKAILDNWAAALPKFWQVVPPAEAGSPQCKVEAAAGVKAAA